MSSIGAAERWAPSDAGPQTEVLIVGAGPTGLVLALGLKRLGIGVRIIDQAAEAGTTSRALVIHARTLELYRQLGLADEIVGLGLEFAAVNLWARGEHAARIVFSDLGRGLSPFPFMLIFPQDQHEKLLIEHLRREGVEVERRTRLTGFEERGDHIVAQMDRDGVSITCRAGYLAGCDGGHSQVRQTLEVGFPGGSYERVYYVADAEIGGPIANHELHIALDEADLLAVFPMKAAHAARLIGTVKRESEAARQQLTWNDVGQGVVERLKLKIERINWFSTYRVHHRVAEQFGRGRAFLLGDAAHVHSPVGGQGMNTGIGDAFNLGWKLADVLRGRAGADLLDSYEPERRAFAQRLVATTDRLFTFTTRAGAVARAVRLEAIPRIVPKLMARPRVRRFMFETISQIRVSYRDLPLSRGRAGAVHGGDRLPWVAPARAGEPDNFTPLSARSWQVHVYGRPSASLRQACAGHGLPLHVFPWQAGAEKAGLVRHAAYLVRPDGYLAWVDADSNPSGLQRYLEACGLRLESTLAPPV
jgi:2-polyprenyl-6-methoxyphenol hydroxylase-like FAD-dependent oxidoreductase